MRGNGGAVTVAEFAVTVGVGAAVYMGVGCAVASADDTASESGSTSVSDAGPKAGRDDDPRDRVREVKRDKETDDAAPDDAASDDDTPSDDEAPATDAPADDADPAEDAAEEDAADENAAENDRTTAVVDVGGDEPTARAEASPTEHPDPLPAPAVAPALPTVPGAPRREAEVATTGPQEPAEASTTSALLSTVAPTPVVYTAGPTFSDQITVFGLRVLQGFSRFVGIDLYGQLGKLLESSRPPWYVKYGLQTRETEFAVAEGNVWTVWEFHPPNPTGKTVIAVHGGGFVSKPTLMHWVDYTSMARETGATVVVPMYPLATTEAGTARKVVPAMAQFISEQIDTYGAENVSLYGDSAGATLAPAAVRELILAGKPVPASMVLLSITPDQSLSNPDLRTIDDPIFDIEGYVPGNHWADGLDPRDPLISPLFFEDDVFAALPPTTIYQGSLEFSLPDALLLHTKWSAAGGAITTVVGQGQIHDWALGGLPLNSQAPQVRPDIYRRLGLDSVAAGPRTIVTAPPSFGDQLVVGALRTLRWFSEVTGIKLFTGIVGTVTSTAPPPGTVADLVVTERTYNGWTVWELAPAHPSGEFVVALHGGGFESEANIIHWSDYASMARDTGATVLVPIYPLAPPRDNGTATTLVPPMADYLSMLIDEHGVDNVSLYGDSAGGSYAMLAVQEMLRRCRSDVQCVTSVATPSRMVLVSPALHLTLTGPEVDAIDDPILPSRPAGEGPQFNGELDMDDPRVNPISSADLTGLPPTAVYIGTLEKLYPGAVAFRDKLLSQDPDADFTFVIGDAQMHGWALGGLFINSQAPVWRPNVYRQLGLLDSGDRARYVTLTVA